MGWRGDWDNGLSAEATYHYYGSVTSPIGGSFETFPTLGLAQPPIPTDGSYSLLNVRAGYRFWQQKAAAGYMRDR
jgi:iron complex outermembrane recepter protein